jgi:hypothetical protein
VASGLEFGAHGGRQPASNGTEHPRPILGQVQERRAAVSRVVSKRGETVIFEEGQALPALWDDRTDDELMGILVSFKGSRADTENLTSLLAQLATLNPPEIAQMTAAGLGAVPAREVAEVLATLLDPKQLGALRRSLATARATTRHVGAEAG